MNVCDATDMFLNACVQGDAEITRVRALLETQLSAKQVTMIINKAKAMGLYNEKPELEQVIIEALEKHKIDDRVIFQSVADQFLLLIYGKKFNRGVNGAFGVAQQILPEARGKNIILRLPAGLDLKTPGYKSGGTWKQLESSINHYNASGRGSAKIEYV